MPLKESEAIVLRTYPLGEGDRLVSFLDRQSGRGFAASRAARGSLRAGLARLWKCSAYIRIWYFERETRELVRINQCELIESFMDVQRDYSSGNWRSRWSAKLPTRFSARGKRRTRSSA